MRIVESSEKSSMAERQVLQVVTLEIGQLRELRVLKICGRETQIIMDIKQNTQTKMKLHITQGLIIATEESMVRDTMNQAWPKDLQVEDEVVQNRMSAIQKQKATGIESLVYRARKIALLAVIKKQQTMIHSIMMGLS